MEGYINNYNFKEMEAMRYYSPPASWDAEKKRTLARDRIFSGDWIAARKMDGYFAQFLKDEDGNMFLLSRSRNVSGEFPNKIEWVPHLQPFFDDIPNGTCLLGELYLPSKPGSSNITTILGCLKEKAIKRQEDEKLQFYIFDVLAYENKLYINESAKSRMAALEHLNQFFGHHYNYINFAIYYEGEELWNQLQEILASGGEGVVLLNKNSKYDPGKRSTKVSLKIKQELKESIDCFFTGSVTPPTKTYTGKEIEHWIYWINEMDGSRLPIKEWYFEAQNGATYSPVTKPYYFGWAGSLEIGLVKENKEIECRLFKDQPPLKGYEIVSLGYISGLTDEIKEHWRDYKGKVIEVGAMMLTDDKRLRHGRMLGFRPDKNWYECTYDQLD